MAQRMIEIVVPEAFGPDVLEPLGAPRTHVFLAQPLGSR